MRTRNIITEAAHGGTPCAATSGDPGMQSAGMPSVAKWPPSRRKDLVAAAYKLQLLGQL